MSLHPSESRPPVTLRDVARAHGVSHVTVSLALRNNPQIPEARRRQIQELARRMGYHPNTAASALALHKRANATLPVREALAWLNHWPQPAKLRGHAEFDHYWQGAYDAAEKFGYRLEEFVCGVRLPLPRLEKILLARGVRGIFLPPHPAGVHWETLRWERFSALRFGRSVSAPRLHVVTSDQVANTMLAFQKIRQRGYDRIGLVTGRAEDRGALYKAGFMMAQESVAPRDRLPILTLEEADHAASRRRLSEWLRDVRPQAILSDVATVHATLAKIGCRTPDHVGLAALSVLDGGVTAGIDQQPQEIGRVAVLLMISLLNDSVRGAPGIFRQILIEGAWVDGPTLPLRRGLTAERSGSAGLCTVLNDEAEND